MENPPFSNKPVRPWSFARSTIDERRRSAAEPKRRTQAPERKRRGEGRCQRFKARLMGAPIRRVWGCSSDGRALQSHCRGQGFDSPQLHQPSSLKNKRKSGSEWAKGSIEPASILACLLQPKGSLKFANLGR